MTHVYMFFLWLENPSVHPFPLPGSNPGWTAGQWRCQALHSFVGQKMCPATSKLRRKSCHFADLSQLQPLQHPSTVVVLLVVAIQYNTKSMRSMKDKNQSESANAFSFHLVEHVDSTW